MNPIRVLNQFKNSLISFIDELIKMFPGESDFVIGRIFINDQIPIESVLESFATKIYDNNNILKDMIKNRNENFFLENNVFSYFGDEKVNKFKTIWTSDALEASDKITMWKWVDIFVVLCDKYYKK
jgi:hypothetical protein